VLDTARLMSVEAGVVAALSWPQQEFLEAGVVAALSWPQQEFSDNAGLIGRSDFW